MVVEFFVPGVPVPQGSKTQGMRGGEPVMWEANKKTMSWRRKVQWHAVRYRDSFPADEPVEMTCKFFFERPKTVKRPHFIVKPDLDKLTRAIGDALSSAKVYGDDKQIVCFGAGHGKYYADGGQKPGVLITLKTIS